MRRLLLVAAATLTLLMGFAAPAYAYDFVYPVADDDIGAASGAYPISSPCGHVDGPFGVAGRACFEKTGDIFHVKSEVTNQIYVYWENWLWNGSAWKAYRHGRCNNQNGAGTWVTCNKDFYESSSTNYFSKKGSRLRFQTCIRYATPDSCNPGSISDAGWFHNDA
jgi:hypothetical protein